MKRRHEHSLDAGPSSPGVRNSGALPLEDNLEKTARQILKRRRVAGPDAWNGKSRSNSALQDIRNLSHHGTALPDDPSTSKIVHNPTGKIPSSALKDYSSLSRPSTPRPTTTQSVASNSEHPGSPCTSSSLPRQSLSVIPLGTQPAPSVSKTTPLTLPPDRPARIRQLRDSQHRYTTNPSHELDSDDGEETDGEDPEEDPGPVAKGEVDSAERELVESRYSEINKLLGGLFLSRRRNPP
ncbi:hypothetical protein BDV93DRAFT_70951 [Ceratobasidium sp. AG-I]|nr:hypothetical protein BDV93DRAFT_70951 [Ceratobasidium sp. AG-I]